jgi:glutathione S-transferase
VAKLNNISIELVDTQPPNVSPEYKSKYNKLGRIPTLVSEDESFVLPEAIAIAVYRTLRCFASLSC